MKTRSTITKPITITMALAVLAAGLLCGAGWLQPVEAQSGDGSVRFVSYASIGIAHRQRLRASVGNPEQATGTLTLSFQYYLAHGTNSMNSAPLYESERIQVAPGGFGFSDVLREDLNTEGDPENGRAQVLVKTVIEAPAGSNPQDFPRSFEVIWGENGAICAIGQGNILRHEVGHILGLGHGQRLSYSFFYPNEEGGAPVRVTTYVYDATGRTISRSAEVELRPGQSHTLSFNRDDLPLAGEPGTGRVQARSGIHAVFLDGSVRPVKLSVSTELVDNLTGGTISYWQGSLGLADWWGTPQLVR